MKNPKDKAANQAGEAVKGFLDMNDPKLTTGFTMAQKMTNAGWPVATPVCIEVGNGVSMVVVVCGGHYYDGPLPLVIRTWDWEADDPKFEISFHDDNTTTRDVFLARRNGLTVCLKENGEVVSPKEAVRLLKAAGH